AYVIVVTIAPTAVRRQCSGGWSMNTRRNGLSLLSAAIAAALLAAPLAHAQNAPPDQNTTTSTESAGTVTTLGTIVVTANRRDETLQKVPMAVSALTYHDIQRQHLKDFSDYAASVPGLDAISLGPGMTELSIRGIASGSQQPSASVGVYVDETPFGSSS